MGTGYSKKKKQAKLFQEQMSKMQEELTTLEVTGQAGNELVTLTLNGDNDITQINIKKECVDPDDIEGLQDLIKAAHRDAQEKLKAKSSKMMPNTGGMGLPF